MDDTGSRAITNEPVSPNLDRYALGTAVPARILSPDTERETADMLAAARASGEAVVPVGGATMLDIGEAPARYDCALITERLSGIVEYNPGDLTVVVRAGTTLAEVDDALRPHGQFLSLQAPHPQLATIGGALAGNASGPLRFSYGSARDALIGIRVALPNGEIARSGGRVVKNVAGYDLAKLFIGSFGTLGVIVEAAFRVHPRRPVRRTFVVSAPGVAAAAAISADMARLGPGVLSVAVVNAGLARRLGEGGTCVVVVIGGTDRATDELSEAVSSKAGESRAEIRGDAESNRLLDELRDFPAWATARLTGRSDQLHVSAADSSDVDALVYPAIGLSYVHAPRWQPDDVVRLRRLACDVGGHVTLWHRSPALAATAVWGDVGPGIQLMKAVKSVFDPDGIMSPGRFVGDI